ncbi:MAG: hypothetical protein EBZ77_00495 [Chitinophagia bacterium]|nr:hypothetical protein [Chitinophagia bacterium]
MAKPVPFLEDAKGAKPVRLYVTVSTPADTKMLAEYISRVNAEPFAFATFGKGDAGYTAKNLKRDLGTARIQLMKSDSLGTTNQGPRTIVYRKIKAASNGSDSSIAVRVNNGTLFWT